MKKILLLTPILTICLCSCGLDWINKILSSEAEKITTMNETIIDAITNQNINKFKELFAPKIRESIDFQQQIDDFFSYFKCEVYINSTYDTVAGGTRYTEYGEILEWDLYPSFRIQTLNTISEDEMIYNYYEVNYYWILNNDQDQDTIGINQMEICLLNYNDPVVIGSFDYQL